MNRTPSIAPGQQSFAGQDAGGGGDKYLFTCCQLGAERALKGEIARRWPEFRPAFSRPGFVTFKLPVDFVLPDEFDLQSVFARTYGCCLGRVTGDDDTARIREFWKLTDKCPAKHFHVWQRDQSAPSERGFWPTITPLAEQIGRQILEMRPAFPAMPQMRMNRIARPGQTVLDCIVVEPREWWIGLHRATSPPSRWPGGIYRQDRPPNAVSRAYLKMREALRWSGLPLEPGQHVVDIGSAPGGASQALLERGVHVLGIDPARMDPSLLDHPHFRHIQKRAAAVKRREFREAQWLVADSNVAPSSSLDAIEAIVTHRAVHIRGMLLTLKLLDWDLAEEIPQYLARIRSWGYQYVRARQLAFNRQEICVVALQRRWLRRQDHRASPRRIGRVVSEGKRAPA